MRAILGAFVAALAVVSPAAGATLTYSDATLADGDWTGTKVVDTTGGAAATFAATQIASGGNPGSFRQTTHTFGPGNITVAHVSAGAVYDPGSLGAIASIDYAFDLIHLNPPPNQAVGYSILLFQGGSCYRASFDLTFDATWTSFAHAGLEATNFALVAGPGPAAPDFSASGSAITAGFVTANTNSGGASSIVRTSGIDDWTISFHSVPEPALAGLLALGSALLLRRHG